MLINTLFLSKPLTLSEHSEGSQSPDKLFGFLFSGIMNVNNQSEKPSLITDHIGGNLIDYKSVFINYNFESTVNLSNPQLKDSKDPIISLSGLFLNSENLNDKKINNVEKIIYSPQQFVSSFTQLINSLLENGDQPANVEIKLFSKNFILSQKIDNNQTKNIEKFLFETIENEQSFSLALSALGKQILFEVFSQVVPSLSTGEAPDNQKVNNSELKNIIQENKPSIQSSSNENQSLDSSIFSKVDSSAKQLKTEAVLTDSDLVKNILTKEQSNSGKLFENTVINTSSKNNIVKLENSESVTNSTINQGTDKEKSSDYESNKNLSFKNNPTKTKDSTSVENSFTSLNKINEAVKESNLEVLKNLQNNQSNSVNQGKNNPTETNKSSENPQIKIIIQDDNKNSVQSTKNINSELIYNLSKILEDNKSQNQQDVIVKIITNSETQQKSSYNVVSDKFFQDHLIAERQIQNLFRSISSGKVNVTGELNIESIQGLDSESLQNSTGNTQINKATNSFENIGTKDTIENISENPAKAAVKDLNLNIDLKATKETFNSAPETISSSNHNDETNKLIEGDNIQEGKNTSSINGLNASQISSRNVKSNSNENTVPSTKHNEITNEKVGKKDLQSTDGLNKQEEVNFRTEFNYRKDKKDNPDHQGSFRVFNEKPAKGILGINSEKMKDEKLSFDSPKVTSEVQKEIKADYKEQIKPELELNKNEKNANSHNSQHDHSKNSNQDIRNIISNEKQLSEIEESYSSEFRKTFNGFEKEANPLTSKNVNHNSSISNKFDFNKFFESKSLENFIRTFNDNNLNYRAELTNSVKTNNTIELRLYPEELGRVKIVIENSESAVSARIEVQSEQAKNIVMSNLPQLREALKQEGLNAHNLNVYLGSEEQKGQNSTNQKRKNSNSKMMFDDQEKNEEAKIKNLGYNTIEYLA